MIRVDAVAGTLDVLDPAALARAPATPDLSANAHGTGRELFAAVPQRRLGSPPRAPRCCSDWTGRFILPKILPPEAPAAPARATPKDLPMTPAEMNALNEAVMRLAPVIPVLVIDDAAAARPLAEALVAGGLPALEVTLRTPAALDAIRAMAEVPGGRVGAGTLLTPEDVRAAKAAGATFGVSPGATPALIAACADEGLPLLAGCATATEVMALMEAGLTTAKFFPAETSGGAPALKALGAPLPQMRFCPTGGVSLKNARDYLALANVLCVGGILGGAGRQGGGGRLGRDRGAGPRSRGAARLTDAAGLRAAPPHLADFRRQRRSGVGRSRSASV